MGARAASAHPECVCHTALRLHVDIGSGKPSRFGLCAEPEYLKTLAARLRAAGNISFDGIQCHISGGHKIADGRPRESHARARTELFPDAPPKFIDLGSGMFGRLPEEMRASFGQNIPTFCRVRRGGRYALSGAVRRDAGKRTPRAHHGAGYNARGRHDAVCRARNGDQIPAGERLRGARREHPYRRRHLADAKSPASRARREKRRGKNLNFTGYTCLEYDILYRYTGPLDVGSSVIFDNIGSYSNVLKPPFIHPDVPMIEYRKGDDSLRLIKRAQTAEEIFAQYVFEE